MALHEGAPGLGPCPVPVPVPAVDVVVAAFVVLQAGGGEVSVSSGSRR